MTPREYIEAVAQELTRLRGNGLLLSPADAQLALSWHAAQVPLQSVVAQLRRAARVRPRGPLARGSTETGFSLQLIAEAVEGGIRRAPRKAAPAPESIAAQLQAAARAPGLPCRAAWEELAASADQLLAGDGGEPYWTAAVRAFKQSLRELPRKSALEAGAALRARLAPRPRGMPRRKYQRSLQLMLLSAASERIGIPPRAFLL